MCAPALTGRAAQSAASPVAREAGPPPAGADCEPELRARFARPAGTPPYSADAPTYATAYTDAEIAEQRQRGTDFRQGLLSAIAAKQTTYTVAPGVYRLAGGGLRLDKVENLVIDCKDVTFITEDTGKGIDLISFNACKDITLRGPAVWDTAHLPFSQGRVLAVDPAGLSFDLDMPPGYALSAQKQGPSRYHVFDAGGRLLTWAQQSFQSIALLKDRTLRVSLKRPSLVPLTPGQVVALEVGKGSLASYNNCENMTVADFTIHTGVAHLYERGTRGYSKQLNIRCVTPAGTNRLIAGQPIQHTFRNGTLIYDGCEFGVGWDDGINLLGKFYLVARQVSPRELIVTQGIDQGSELLFYGFDSFDPLGGARVVQQSEEVDSRAEEELLSFVRKQRMHKFDRLKLSRILLDRDVQVPPYTVIDCSTARANEVIVRNCYFHDANAQILLLQGAKKGLVENNLLERSAGAAIQVGFSMYWLEGPIPGDFVIRNNVIRDNPVNLPTPRGSPGSICIVGGTVKPTKNRFIHNIVIENNTIYNPSCAGIYARNASNVIIRNNLVIRTVDPQLVGERGRGLPSAPIDLDSVSHATVENNTVVMDPLWAAKPVAWGADVDSVIVTNNRVHPPAKPLGNTPPEKSRKP
ncbi:MAG: right-handed parallel beta-helix repeat-containing protein [Verrucomicrobia bacterium]|nr:right-handed parallel beta-helix repeat-containing protein [Verrucomicrobiota bacterium]